MPNMTKTHFEYLQRKVPMYNVIADLLRLEEHIEAFTKKDILDSHIVRKNHEIIADFCEHILESEGFNPVCKEITITGFPVKYRADVVGYQDGKIHTVIEIGTLSDPTKISLFSQAFPRFIWIPFAPILDLQELMRTCAIIEKWPEVVNKLSNDFEAIQTRIIDHANKQVDQASVELAQLNEACGSLRALKEALEKDIELLHVEVNSIGKPSVYRKMGDD